MESETSYVKRSQRDYSLSFKLQVVQSIERGEVSVKSAQRQYGIQGNTYYRSIAKRVLKQDKAQQVVEMVQGIRSSMSRIGNKKLYHLLLTKHKISCSRTQDSDPY